MHRSFAENMGVQWPPEWAYVVIAPGEPRRAVTWSERRVERQAAQRLRLARIEQPSPPRRVPAYVWVFRVPGWLYTGWWCYVVTRHEQISVNGRPFRRDLAASVMRAAPCGFLPMVEYFSEWMPVFTGHYPRPAVSDPRPAGSLVGWLTDRRQFSLKGGTE